MQFIGIPIGDRHHVVLDISDMEMEGKEKLKQYLEFNGDTYKPIKEYSTNPSEFYKIFGAPNWFLSKATTEEKIEVIKFFASAQNTIRNSIPSVPSEFVNFVEVLGHQYLNMINASNALTYFRRYADEHVSLQDTSLFGTRPQDTEALTFYEPEIKELMVVAMCCKLAAPILSELINNLPKTISDNGKKKMARYKESRCANLIMPLLSTHFPDLTNKLLGYIRHTILSSKKNSTSNTAYIFHGLTANTRTALDLNSLLVRNYVLCNLETPDSNIVRYTATMINVMESIQDTTAHKNQVTTRQSMGNMAADDESGNVAQIEIDSLISTSTMDITIIIESCIDRVIENYRLIYEITKSEFDECLRWFEQHPIYVTPLNKFVACVTFGRDIGGGRGIETIGAASYTKLIAMLQLISFSMGYYHLGVALTASRTLNSRIQINMDVERFRRQAPTLTFFRTVKAKFSHATSSGETFSDLKKNMRETEWDRQMEELISDLANTIYAVNVPEHILDQLNEHVQIENDTTIEPVVEITEQMCMLIDYFSNLNNTINS